jgi:hypothetical protein
MTRPPREQALANFVFIYAARSLRHAAEMLEDGPAATTNPRSLRRVTSSISRQEQIFDGGVRGLRSAGGHPELAAAPAITKYDGVAKPVATFPNFGRDGLS